MGGGGSNLGVRMEGQLSGPVTDIVLEPGVDKKHTEFSWQRRVWDQLTSFFTFNKIVVAYCISWLPPNSAVIPLMTVTELYICSVFRNETCLF